MALTMHMTDIDGVFTNALAGKLKRAGYKATYLDMDGSISDLYAVPNWLEKLRAEDPSPYAEAAPLVDVRRMNRILRALRDGGIHVGVVSWLSKCSSPTYDRDVIAAKQAWLRRYFPILAESERHFVPYGTPKSTVVDVKDAVLVDDEEQNLREWCSCHDRDRAAVQAIADGNETMRRLRKAVLAA